MAQNSAAAGLLRRQFKEMQNTRDLPGISCGLVNDNVFEWEVMLMISDDCKYYGGKSARLLTSLPKQCANCFTSQEATFVVYYPSHQPTLSSHPLSNSKNRSPSTQIYTQTDSSAYPSSTHPKMTNTATNPPRRDGPPCRLPRPSCSA